MAKQKKSGFKPIELEVTSSEENRVINSDWDYLWIGDISEGGRCYGTVPDKDVRRLRDRCNEILEHLKDT